MSLVRLSIVVLLVGATVVAARSRTTGSIATLDAAALPYTIGSWRGVEAPPIDADTIREVGADGFVNRTYSTAAGAPVGLYVAFYAQPRPALGMHSPLNCLPGTGWEPLDVGTAPIDRGDETTGEARRMVVRKGLDRALVLYWYQIHGRMIAGEIQSKLWLLHDGLRLNRRDAALVRLVVPIGASVSDADRSGAAFARALAPLLPRLWS